VLVGFRFKTAEGLYSVRTALCVLQVTATRGS
jgi:hypothetical protein